MTTKKKADTTEPTAKSAGEKEVKPSIFQRTSWKTTTFSITSVLATVLAMIVNPLLDGNPETNPNWTEAMPVILAGLGLLFARDNNKSSKQIGVE
jgi:hypothetical protein